MKTIKMASYGTKPEEHGYSVLDLLEQMPSVMLIITSIKIFPSLPVLNDLFSKEGMDFGMSGGVSWEKFELSEADWMSLKEAVSEKYKIDFVKNDELDALNVYSKWASNSLKYCRTRN